MRLFLIISFCSLNIFAQISGTIIDSVTQDPIEGALVRFQTRTTVVSTDSNGVYNLNDTSPGNLVGAAYGYFNGAIQINSSGPQTGVTISLDPIDTTNAGNPLNTSSFCSSCHADLKNQYTDSPMSKSGMNTWVFDLLDGSATPFGMESFVYTRDSTHVDHAPFSECASCHSPGHYLNNPGTGMGDFHNPTAEMLLGVQCEICHRAYNLDENKTNWPGIIPPDEGGAFTLIQSNEAMEFGLLGDVDNQVGMRGSYNPQLASRICAACHEDNNDSDEDGDYEDDAGFAGAVPSETTYSEWLIYQAQNGVNTKSCVDCHMPIITELSSFCIISGLDRTGQVRNHTIRGTTPEFLENAVDFTVTQSLGLDRLTVDVTITNSETGHSVPTGVTVRNVILLLLVKDPLDALAPQISGDQIDAVGGIDPNTLTTNIDSGYYVDLPGKAFYLKNFSGTHERVFYTEAITILEDSRIKPGETYQETFEFGLPDGISSLNVDVRLLYRRGWRELIDAKHWTTTGTGEPLEDILAPFFGHLMERSESTVDICSGRDIDGSGSVDSADFDALKESWWLGTPPFSSESHVDIRHLLAVMKCIE